MNGIKFKIMEIK